MKTQGHYTAPGPPRAFAPPELPRGLVLLVLAIVAVGLLALIYRFNPAPTPAPTAAPAPVAALPIEQPRAAKRIFVDEILASRQLAPADLAGVQAQLPAGPVAYRLPAAIPALWLTCRPCADEALAALMVPARAAASAPAAAVVSWAPPDTRAVCARSRIFADEILASAVYDLSAARAYAPALVADLPARGLR